MNINNNMKGSPMRPIWQTPTPQQPTVAVVTSLAANQALASLMVGNGYVPPVLTTSGTDISGGTGTTKMVVGSSTLVFSSSVYSATVTVTLSGSAVFTSSSTYRIIGSMVGVLGSPVISPYFNATSGSAFTINGSSPTSQNGSVVVNWIAIGY
jgi:hypothetical protein